MAQRPVVEHGVARPVSRRRVRLDAVLADQVTLATPPMLSTAQRPRQRRRERGMNSGTNGAPLPAGRDIGAAKSHFTTAIPVSPARSGTVADLPGPAALRLMQDRLAESR